MPICTDYKISAKDAKSIMGASLLPNDIRYKNLELYLEQNGIEKLLNLFSQFMGLANSVTENAQEWLEILLVINGGVHPDKADKFNRSTIFGALNGCVLAEGIDQDKLCHGCAFRIGSCANQSPSTTCDADLAMADNEMFYCHEVMDGNEPLHKCRGYLQARKSTHQPL